MLGAPGAAAAAAMRGLVGAGGIGPRTAPGYPGMGAPGGLAMLGPGMALAAVQMGGQTVYVPVQAGGLPQGGGHPYGGLPGPPAYPPPYPQHPGHGGRGRGGRDGRYRPY